MVDYDKSKPLAFIDLGLIGYVADTRTRWQRFVNWLRPGRYPRAKHTGFMATHAIPKVRGETIRWGARAPTVVPSAAPTTEPTDGDCTGTAEEGSGTPES